MCRHAQHRSSRVIGELTICVPPRTAGRDQPLGLFRDAPARGDLALSYDRDPRASRRHRLLEHRIPRLRRRPWVIAPASVLPGFWLPASPKPALPAGHAPLPVRPRATKHRLVFAVHRGWVRSVAGTIWAQQRLISAKVPVGVCMDPAHELPRSPAPCAHQRGILVSLSHRICVPFVFLFWTSYPPLCIQPQLSSFSVSPPLSRCSDMQSLS